MAFAKGIVEDVRAYDTKFGKMYSVILEGESYGTGKEPPKVNAGDQVEFEFSYNGKYRNIDMKSGIKVTGRAPAQGHKTAAASLRNDDRQTIISKQAALNSALAFVDMLLKAEAVPGITKTAKAEQKYGILEALVLDRADFFYKLNTGHPVSPSAATEAAEKAATDGEWE